MLCKQVVARPELKFTIFYVVLQAGGLMKEWHKEIEKAASILSKSTKAVALCGSGVSAESGLATFRDAGGIWDKLNPAEVGTTEGLINTLDKKADMLIPVFIELLDTFEKAEPNPGHKSLARMENIGILNSVITQNVDNLHQESGSVNVIEVHGSFFRMRCLSCGKLRQVDRKSFIKEIKDKLRLMKNYKLENLIKIAPVCNECGSLMRPDVVMFGEAVQHMNEAYSKAEKCDVMLVLGTSGLIYPVASLPMEADRAGAKIIVINPNENNFAGFTDVYIPMKTGVALPAIMEKIKKK
jgi:NAD-dependent deacetylase